jgi:YD repeat-containing protein
VVSDAAQRPLLQSGGEMTTTTITYTYDALYRLTNATYSTGDVFTYTYDAANRLINVGGVAQTWDNNGIARCAVGAYEVAGLFKFALTETC